MESFIALSARKQNAILDAGLQNFGRLGYRKASVRDIAQAAGISKGMIFHYFGSKKQMYLYLLQVAYEDFTQAFQNGIDNANTDFFDRIRESIRIKMEVLKVHPAFFQFLVSVYFETDPEVQEELQEFLKKDEAFRNELVLTPTDKSKFKETVDPQLVLKLLVKYSEGCVGSNHLLSEMDLDAILMELEQIIHMMKQNFYKEDYL